MNTFYEFFSGGGMARLGLGPSWKCLLANDIDEKKAGAYRANFGGAPELKVGDIAKFRAGDLPGTADLAWASFPCQDLSLAGAGAGLSGQRSGTFWPFWRLVQELAADGRKPAIVTLENVCGTLTSHGGRDFLAIAEALASTGYRFGAMVIDAVHFVPQSRPRLFIVGVDGRRGIAPFLIAGEPQKHIHPPSLRVAQRALSVMAKNDWIWWRLRLPEGNISPFADLIEDEPVDVPWVSLAEKRRLLAMMSPINLAKVQSAQLMRRRIVGTVYRRTRLDENGKKVQRAEVRFDDVAGCLRTPAGGSSRQRILVVDRNSIRARLLSAREAARLMGLPDSYQLPERYNDAYHLVGDGVVVPVVRHLANNLLDPLLNASDLRKQRAA